MAVLDLPLAHSIGYPHPEPVKSDSGGGASVILIVVVIVVTVILAVGLFWVRERVRRAEAAEAAADDETEPAAG